MPALYIVATPIGNLQDISLRALDILRNVELIATEDTRKTRRLLSKYAIKTPMTSYYEHNKLSKLAYILKKLDTGDIALVSEAGMPGISDPGYELVKKAIETDIPVIPIPGASAVTTALAVSGLPTDRFLFIGFLPARTSMRRRTLKEVCREKSTIIIYEAPHRIHACLKDILTELGDRRIAVCRELTKIHEEVFRGTVSEAIAYFQSPRGEFTLVVAGNTDTEEPETTDDIESQLKEMRRSGKTAKESVSILTKQTGLSKKELYRMWLKQK